MLDVAFHALGIVDFRPTLGCSFYYLPAMVGSISNLNGSPLALLK